jgi:energy-coupling factor transporter ATP-binding protein EcfA2
MNPIVLEGLTVRYGDRLALDSVSFTVPEGSVYALLGRNGAGKSSLVRCLLGGQKPASGRVQLLDRDAWTARAGRTETTGRLSGVNEMAAWALSPDGSCMVLRTGSRLQLRDARTGELLASLGAGKQASASFLTGGRIAVPIPLPGASWELQILAPDGTTKLRRFHFDGVQDLIPVDQPSPGTLRIVMSRTGGRALPGRPGFSTWRLAAYGPRGHGSWRFSLRRAVTARGSLCRASREWSGESPPPSRSGWC